MSDAKPTIEWRQHEGTIDAERVTTWVETVVGIVNFACHAPRQDLHTLLSMAANEHWEKLGDGQDRKRERKMGAIIAESWFKAADLFEWMGLTKFADFYRDRTYIIEKFCAAEPYARWITWDYEKKDIILSKEEKESLHVRRELFDCLRKMKLDENSDIKFDPNDPFWPPHQDQKEGMAQDTDASSPRLEGSSLSSGPSERSEPKSEGLEDSGSSSDEEFKLKAEENSIYRIEKEAKRAAKLETKRKEADGEEEFDESEDVIE
ncbi:hypothetical protein BDZ45DRAFT_406063 [Acephala macrosclerotiorum]|nr:hypothetical protein BDZ45DRAFT_406063 [Acephala macrosclerotiorum]